MNFPDLKPYRTVKDHSVSGEVFELHRSETYDLLATIPQPASNELGRYYESEDYISHTDAKRTLLEKLYQAVKTLSIRRKIELIDSYSAHKGKLLDIGAGTGDFLTAAQDAGWDITGVEPGEKAAAIASAKGLNLIQESFDLKDHSFDIITMWHVLEHVPDPQLQIKELKRLLKPGGTIIVAVPNFNSYDAKHYGEFWAAYDVPRHLWHFSKTAISKLFAEQGMKVIDTKPMKFDAFYVSLLSEKYKTGKMDYFRAFFTGLRSNSEGAQSEEYSSHTYIIKTLKIKISAADLFFSQKHFISSLKK